MAPEYLSELLSVYNPGRQLRSSGKSLLVTPKYNLKSYGQGPFLVLPLYCGTVFQTI